MKQNKVSEKETVMNDLRQIIAVAMRTGKPREAVDAIKTLAQMKGWSRGEEEATDTILLDLKKIPGSAQIAMGIKTAPADIEKQKKLEAYYATHYKN